ncbi:MFS transporter [Sporolactobacillus terrae]|uniref:MFS transporter n=1 Tax=Sporolactobacillus terrae TaxID=269673 RepID=UPI00048DAF7A|nr:MFS transporter [Sporolactobacillus terrae]
MLDILKSNYNFKNFFFAINISYIGDAVDDIIFSMLIFQITKSAFMTGLVFVIRIFFSFISIFTASFTDYWDKKKVIILSELGKFISLLGFLFVYLIITPPIWFLFVVIIVNAGFGAFSTPAKSGLIGYIIQESNVVKGRSLIYGGQNLSQVIGYTLAGIIVSISGYKLGIMLDLLSFIVGILLIRKVICENVPTQKNRQNFLKSSIGGIKLIFTKNILFLLAILSFIGNFAISPVESLMPAYLGFYFHHAYYLSIFSAISTISSLLGVYLIPKLNKILKNNYFMAIGFGCGVIGVYSLTGRNVPLLVISALFIGLSNSLVSTLNASMIQINTPKEFLGRVFSAFKFVSFSISPLSILVVGAITSSFSLLKSFSILGFLLFISVLLSLLLKPSSVDE